MKFVNSKYQISAKDKISDNGCGKIVIGYRLRVISDINCRVVPVL